ncbi:MAG: nucleotidyltransferase family protein, partial [Paracoccaceae bacterium]
MHGADEAMASGPRALGRADVRYLCGVGLGPIAWSLTDAGRLAVPEECRETLHGAELTTRLIHRKMTLTAAELVDELRLAGVVPVLIKGISTSDQFYDPPHHRVMGDVDVLVEAAALEPAASVMKKLRYAAIGATPPDGAQWDHHHLPAARHPDSGVVVELHTGLFPPGSSAVGEPLFQVSHFREYLCESEFQGRSVYRFTPEFQLAYTVAHWAGDRKWPSNVISINDVLHIIRRSAGFDWRLIDDWMRDSDWLAAGISVMLRYLIDC